MNINEEDKTFLRESPYGGFFEYDEKRSITSNGTFRENIRVIATLDQFNMIDKVVQDYEIKLLDKDPIVLQGIKGGYLIITKWGAEENVLI